LRADGVTRVALLLPLTGRRATLGQAMLKAAQLALFDIADDRFALVVRDTGGTPTGAQMAARSALEEGAALILGPLFSTSVRALAPVARAQGVNVVTFSNDLSVAGNGIFVMGLAPQAQVDRVVNYAIAQGIRSYAVLAPTSAYGNAVMRAMQQAVQRNGAELARVVSYAPQIGDASTEVRALGEYDRRRQALIAERQRLAGRGDAISKGALKALEGRDTLGAPPFEAVMLPVGGKSLLSLAPLLPFYDVDPGEVRFLGTALWDDPQLGTEPALTGAWFAAPPPELWNNFKERYQSLYGETPPRVASLAYDATALAVVLAGRAQSSGATRLFDSAAVADPSGFAGVDGIFRFKTTGEVERGLAVLEMRRAGFRVLDPPPQKFERLAF